MFDSWESELGAVGISPLSECGLLGRDDQYGTALAIGYKLLEQDDEQATEV